jgi:hypothetical protein
MGELICPEVHRNGTSGETLLQGYCDAGAFVRQSIEELQKSAPNMRDYYLNPEGAARFKIAEQQHKRRIEGLRSVMDELAQLAQMVCDQMD